MSEDDDMKRARAYDLLATRDGAIDVTFDDDVTALAEALAAERAAGAREMRERATAVAVARAEHLTSLRPSHPATLETANELRDIALDIQDIEALDVEVSP